MTVAIIITTTTIVAVVITNADLPDFTKIN